ncbi:MAG: hypothetical protein J6K29_00855 [Clostridia bacterium]|nr:hypothetical protein [Clostridia bacterium]
MRIKYHLFLDRRQLLSLFFAIFSGWMTVELIRDEGNAWWVLWGILTLLMTAMALALPCLYLMTPKGLHIIHTFGLIRRFIPWDSVMALEVNYDSTGYSRHFPYLFDTFCIYGDVQGPTFFFTEDEMVRTLRARILLEKYTGLKVEGFLWQDIRDARKNRKEKKERERRRRQRQERVDRNRKAREQEKQSRKQAGDKRK